MDFVFWDSWLWLIFVIIGLAFIILELLVGVDTGYDLVFLGSALIIGGLITWPFYSWIITLIVTAAICAVYVVLGRKYINRWRLTKEEKTNIDTIINKKGIVLRNISKNSFGLVKIDNEKWRARASEDIKPGEEVVVTGIKGVTITVEKIKGG